MFRCTRCLMPSTRPRIEFNAHGICNACQHEDWKREHDWDSEYVKLLAICDRFRSNNGEFDCIIPVSGGKDSSYIAYQFKYELKMNPLTVTFSHPMPTRMGWINWQNFVQTGFDNILITPNSRAYRKFARDAFIERGMPKQPFVCGISTAIIKIAKKFDIRLICFAEQGEVEYGGQADTEVLKKFDYDFLTKIYYEGQTDTGDYGPWWELPSKEDLENLYVTWWSKFENWDTEPHAIFAKTVCGMQMHTGGNIGTFTNYSQNEDMLQDLHMYLAFIKFGFGRCCADASIEIRKGRMTREQGLKVTRQLDGTFPLEYLDAYCDYFELSEQEFWLVVDSFANKDLLVKTGDKVKPWALIEGIA